MIKVLMTPGPGARDDNGVGNVIWHYGKHAAEFGIEFVGPGEPFDVEIAHAGVKEFEDPSGPNIAMLHGLYWGDTELGHTELEANSFIVSSIRHAKAVTVPSSWVGECLRRDMHITPYVIPHGVDFDDWQGGERIDHVVLWGKNRSDKVCDPEWAVKLARMFPGIRFLSTFGRALENMAVTGPLPRDTMRAVIRSSSIYLSTTEETFGVTTLEAMAAGCPVLGFNHGGNVDIVKNGVTGWLADPGDMDGLAEGLKFCLENWQALSSAAREEAKKWSWPAAMSKLAHLIHDVAEEKPPTFAIVVPCYNKRDTIRDTVISALNQTIECEVVVVDDGSTDGSVEQINDLAGVRIITQDNQGVAHARNNGIASTGAGFICCLDSDDTIEPNYIEVCYSKLAKDRSIGIAFTGITAHYPNGRSEQSQWPNGFNFERQMQQSNQVPTCCLFRREIWERLGGYRQRYAPHGAGAEDAELWLRFGAIGYRAAQASRDGLFHYSVGQGATSQGRGEYPWLSWHPWTKDGEHPFGSIANPKNGLSHLVRKYNSPKISVVIPVKPEHETLVIEVLDSLEAQTFRNWEVILVYDGGRPRLPHSDSIDLFEKAYPYARWGSFKVTRGAGAARNLGISMARAPLVYLCDADDWLEPTCLESHYQSWMVHGGVVYSNYFGLNPPDLLESERIVKNEDGKLVVVGELPDYDCPLALQQPDVERPYSWCAVNALIPTDLLQRIKFNENLPSLEDWELFINIARSGVCFHKIKRPLWVYNFTSGERRSIGQSRRREIVELFEIKESAMGCGCNEDNSTNEGNGITNGTVENMALKDGYLLVEYRPTTRGRHPVWGVVTPKENYGMKQIGNIFPVKAGDIALMGGKFVCAYCKQMFITDVRNRKAWCICPQSQVNSGAANVVATQQAISRPSTPPAQPTQRVFQVTPQSVSAPVRQEVIRDDPDKPVPVAKGQPDDFTRITGVGPRTAELLVNKGIRTFTSLMRMDEAGLRMFGVQETVIPKVMEYIREHS